MHHFFNHLHSVVVLFFIIIISTELFSSSALKKMALKGLLCCIVRSVYALDILK